jgi:NAD(P)-dependent dehydrogenase (short-subunit alcohol dehydrogenase family)
MSAILRDQTVLVVGRGGGIARAVTLAVRGAGARVVVAGRDRDVLDAAYDDPGISAETVDLTDERSIASLAERLGQVDHVVSTASARARGRVADLTQGPLLLSLNTKVIGPIMLAKHFAARMPQHGSFVLFSGSSALKPAVGVLGVAITNGAVDVLTRSLAVELAPIRVNAISPGTVDTGAWDGLGEEKKREMFAVRAARNPARRVGIAQDVGEAVLFALTNTFMTGVSLPIDGGEPLV